MARTRKNAEPRQRQTLAAILEAAQAGKGCLWFHEDDIPDIQDDLARKTWKEWGELYQGWEQGRRNALLWVAHRALSADDWHELMKYTAGQRLLNAAHRDAEAYVTEYLQSLEEREDAARKAQAQADKTAREAVAAFEEYRRHREALDALREQHNHTCRRLAETESDLRDAQYRIRELEAQLEAFETVKAFFAGK